MSIAPTPFSSSSALRAGKPRAEALRNLAGRTGVEDLASLAAMLIQKRKGANATVTVCHTGTADLPRFTLQADILVAAMGGLWLWFFFRTLAGRALLSLREEQIREEIRRYRPQSCLLAISAP